MKSTTLALLIALLSLFYVAFAIPAIRDTSAGTVGVQQYDDSKDGKEGKTTDVAEQSAGEVHPNSYDYSGQAEDKIHVEDDYSEQADSSDFQAQFYPGYRGRYGYGYGYGYGRR